MANFWSTQLVIALALNAVVQAIQIGAYAARLAGVRSGRIATSISLFNLFVTASRLANLAYAPMLGAISDRAALAARNPDLAPAAFHIFAWQIRAIVLAGAFGTALGTLLLPTFLHVFLRGIASFERRGSIPRALLQLGKPRVLAGILRATHLPDLTMLRGLPWRGVPRNLLVGNVVVTGIYAIGVVAATYASVLDPADARTAVLLSGIINGIATIAFTLIVDPTSALITDQAVRGERSLAEVQAMVYSLAFTAILGTLLSQAILDPAAHFIAFVAHVVQNVH